MKLSWFKAALAFAGLALAAPSPAKADVLLSENFDYAEGGLYGQGSWVHHSKNVNEPIQLVTPGLTYAGYQDEAKGMSAKLIGTDATTAHERLQKQFADEGITSGTVYLSALVRVDKEPAGEVYFMSLCQRGAKADAGVIDEKSGSEYPRIFVGGISGVPGLCYFGISKNAAATHSKTGMIQLGQTYLLVVKYEFVDGTNNDKVTLWVNPAKGAEPEAVYTGDAAKADASTTMGLQAVTLRQGSAGEKIGADMLIDAVRVTTTWDEIWDATSAGGSETPEPGDAVITAPASVDFGQILQYAPATATVNIKATCLTGDITVSSTNSAVTPVVTTIPMDEAMSAAGYDLTLTCKASAATVDGSLNLSAAGAETVSVSYAAEVVPVSVFANFRQVPSLSPELIYLFQGKATVTHVDLANSRLYAQDIYGGGAVFELIMLNNELTLKVGDRFTNAYCFPGEEEQGITPLYLYDVVAPTVTAEDVAVEPLEITFGELARDAETYANRLVKVLDVDFGSAAGQNFTTAGVAVTSGDESGRVRAFAGTDIIGTAIPAAATSVTGISTSAAAAIVTMRSLADLEAAGDPADAPKLEVERQMIMDANEYQEINKTVEFGKLTVTYANLEKPAAIWLGGKDRAMFSIDTEEIPAGSGTAEILISYTPTTKGRHSATINFDATPVELSQSIAMSAKAYDPAVTPTITVNTDGLTEFEAPVNGTHEQTITYTTSGLLDLGSIKVDNPGTFIISTASMLTDGTGSLRITFNPRKEGEFTETITFSADKAESVTITVKGHTTGADPTPVETEGDKFTMDSFDTTDARALLIEDFQSLGAKTNKPFHLDGWTNVALTGTRAWWAYNELNTDNWAAKVTAYDSKATESTDAQMLLLSPCLDYVNAKQQILTFRIMGKLMTEGMTDNLQVIYIDPTTETTQTLDVKPSSVADSPLANVWAEEIGGLNIPASPDYNDEWIDYVVDLNGMELADRFFIAFGYTSERGTSTTTSYLVDDFTWGRDDIAFIRPSLRWLDMETTVNTTAVSADITVEGLNLDQPISLKMTGANASKFTVEPATLPAEGGTFHVTFLSPDEGVHAAYVSLTSEGAPESLISVEANNKSFSGIEDVTVDGADAPVDVYNLQGILLRRGVKASEATAGLPAGLYIVGGTKVLVK